MRKLLITGFDPFGGASINPAWEAVKLLPEQIGDFEIYKLEIPTVFGLAAETVLTKADVLQPDVILCIGQAVSGRYYARYLTESIITHQGGITPPF